MSIQFTSDELALMFDGMDARSEAFVDFLGFELRWADTSDERRYWIINPRTGKTIFGGKKGRDCLALDTWIEARKDDFAIVLGFKNALALRELAQFLKGKDAPRSLAQRMAFDHFLAEAGLGDFWGA